MDMKNTKIKKKGRKFGGMNVEAVFGDLLTDVKSDEVPESKLMAKSEMDFLNRKDLNIRLKQVSGCGPYQIYVYILTLWPQLMSGFVLLQNVFILRIPESRCFLPQCESIITHSPWTTFNHTRVNVDKFIPRDSNGGLSSCSRYQIASSYDTNADHGSRCREPQTNTTEPCRDGYIYDLTAFMKTAAMEWGLTCDRKWMKQVSASIFMSGMLFASVICGYLSDKFGRRSVFMWAPGLSVFAGITAAHSNGIVLYTISSFLMSFCAYGMIIADFTIGVETVPVSWRLITGNSYPITFAIGQGIMTGIFYATDNWRHTVIVITYCNLSLTLLPLLIPESIKWQISKGDTKDQGQAEKEIERIARVNKMTIIKAQPSHTDLHKRKLPQATMTEMLKDCIFLTWTIVMCFGWFVGAFTYYGLTFATGSMTKEIPFYASFIGMTMIEVPFVLSLSFLVKCMGRRILFISTLFTAGIMCFIAAFMPSHLSYLTIYFAILGKGADAMCFALVYTYTVEIFPTSTRTFGLGFSSMWARVGTILSPLIAELDWYGVRGPLGIFGCLCIIAGLLGFLLPETKGRDLPDTLEDLHKLRTKSNYSDENSPTA
jgi:OCT family organic cation transporter-like MFS transporter 4/5